MGRTNIWTRVSDSASDWVKPCAMNEPSMSGWTFLSGPKRFATTCLAIPMILPRPTMSFSDGRKLFKRGDAITFIRPGSTVNRMIAGRVSSVVWMYWCTSESVARNPKG